MSGALIRTKKPKNARSKRALEHREPKERENPKTAIFVRGSRTSDTVNTAMRELGALKKPEAIAFNKKNSVLPFEDDASLCFFSQKNDASLLVVGSSQKKRKDNLIWVRMFDYQVLDILEMGIVSCVPMHDPLFKGVAKPGLGLRPLFHFSGPQFTSEYPDSYASGNTFDDNPHAPYQHLKSLLLDFYRGQELPPGPLPGQGQVALTGLQYVISVTAEPFDGPSPSSAASSSKQESDTLANLYAATASAATDGTAGAGASYSLNVQSPHGGIVHFRVYTVSLLASGTRLPKVQLSECGPRFVFDLRRRKPALPDALRASLKRPKTALEKNSQGKQGTKRKNLDTDEMGDLVGQIHVGKQDLSKLQTRKMVGLKKNRDADEDEDEDDDEEDEDGQGFEDDDDDDDDDDGEDGEAFDDDEDEDEDDDGDDDAEEEEAPAPARKVQRR
ncbi:rRNA-binding ribosome biosynthesis protein rpf2 [Tilletia horrida]|nr:rRNA-binding ribosome biosynthesis protein rpf2 [Tilletia horrida]